jgi:hypothetical protein
LFVVDCKVSAPLPASNTDVTTGGSRSIEIFATRGNLVHNLGIQTQTEASMAKSWAPIIATLSASLFLAANLGCGNSSHRQLQSIAINGTGMIQFQFTATGTFNASPMTVNPLPVSWYTVDLNPSGVAYTLTSQPFQVSCQNSLLIALAPTDPKAASSGTIPSQVYQDLVVAHTTTAEGGFIASSPQYLACP